MTNPPRTDATRRRFLLKGGAASLAGATLLHAQSTPPRLSTGDIAILRFSIANELIGGDIWQQYADAIRGSQAYAQALASIDPLLPQYMLDTTRSELSHGRFLVAYAAAMGVPAVDLSPFRTLQTPDAVSQLTRPTLTNLSALNIDTSWFFKYRNATNPDFGQEPPQLATLNGVATVPNALSPATNNLPLAARAALMHVSLGEQLESSTYLSLGGKITSPEMQTIAGGILPVEMMHYTAFQTSLARMSGFSAGNVAIPDLRQNLEAAQVIPEPAPLLPTMPDLPPVSTVRPWTTPRAGAVVAVQRLTASNVFQGQPQAFFDMMQQMAAAADAAVRGV